MDEQVTRRARSPAPFAATVESGLVYGQAPTAIWAFGPALFHVDVPELESTQ